MPHEDKEENSNSKIFLTPPQSPKKAQYRSTKFEEIYMHELSKRQLARLLSIHEHIVANLLNILHHYETPQTKPPTLVT